MARKPRCCKSQQMGGWRHPAVLSFPQLAATRVPGLQALWYSWSEPAPSQRRDREAILQYSIKPCRNTSASLRALPRALPSATEPSARKANSSSAPAATPKSQCTGTRSRAICGSYEEEREAFPLRRPSARRSSFLARRTSARRESDARAPHCPPLTDQLILFTRKLLWHSFSRLLHYPHRWLTGRTKVAMLGESKTKPHSNLEFLGIT